jgi:phage-related protein
MGADWSIEQYVLPSGERPFERFVRSLSGITKVRAASLPSVLADGNSFQLPQSRALGRGLFELRDHCGVRIFYVFRPGHRVMILGGYLKKRQDIPQRVLRTMRNYQADVEANDESTT